jgi:AAA+ ATPase superfamily predicted ATPase
MRSDQQLILSALGLRDIEQGEIEDLERTIQYINLYLVSLPDKFKGLPSVWFFGVLPENTSSDLNRSAIIWEAHALINELRSQQLPIVFISDDARISFLAELKFKDYPIFFIDKYELPGKDNLPGNIKDAPFLMSARRRFKNSSVYSHLSPYSPNRPVKDWRFFGRKNEIKKIVESRSNFFVIGARRIGKTSLLLEVQRQLAKQGEHTYWIECQYKDIGEIIADLAKRLSARDLDYAIRSKKMIDANFFATVLRRLKGEHKSVVFFFDEIGNAISTDVRSESWRFMGVLRELSHSADIRFILSAFQETIIKQMENHDGPFINFGTPLKVYPFKKIEIEEFLISPLHFWGKIRDRRELGNFVKKNYGSHPLVLQFLGEKLFSLIIKNEGGYVDDLVKDYDTRDHLKQFEGAVQEIYNKIDYLERYVFLKLCLDLEKESPNLSRIEIRQERVKEVLIDIGVESKLDTRTLLLERLNLRGLLSQDPIDHSIFRIDCPIIYYYLKNFYKPLDLLRNYVEEIHIGELDISKLTW